MSDNKTIFEKSMAQTDEAFILVKEISAMCKLFIEENKNLGMRNAMLHYELKRMSDAFHYMQRCYGGLDGANWDKYEELAKAALNATQADVDAWKAALIPT